jgi:hypothetical protein
MSNIVFIYQIKKNEIGVGGHVECTEGMGNVWSKNMRTRDYFGRLKDNKIKIDLKRVSGYILCSCRSGEALMAGLLCTG